MSTYSSMVRNRDHSPLGRELFRRVVSSAFAPCSDARLSSMYSFLPTDALLDRMASGGFQPVAAQEQRSAGREVCPQGSICYGSLSRMLFLHTPATSASRCA